MVAAWETGTSLLRNTFSVLSPRCAISPTPGKASGKSAAYRQLDNLAHLPIVALFSSFGQCYCDAGLLQLAKSVRGRCCFCSLPRLHSEATASRHTFFSIKWTGGRTSFLQLEDACTWTPCPTATRHNHTSRSSVRLRPSLDNSRRARPDISGNGGLSVSPGDSPAKQQRAFFSTLLAKERLRSQSENDFVHEGPVQPLGAVSCETLAGIPWYVSLLVTRASRASLLRHHDSRARAYASMSACISVLGRDMHTVQATLQLVHPAFPGRGAGEASELCLDLAVSLCLDGNASLSFLPGLLPSFASHLHFLACPGGVGLPREARKKNALLLCLHRDV